MVTVNLQYDGITKEQLLLGLRQPRGLSKSRRTALAFSKETPSVVDAGVNGGMNKPGVYTFVGVALQFAAATFCSALHSESRDSSIKTSTACFAP